MDGSTVLLIFSIIEIVVFLILYRYGVYKTYANLAKAIIDAIKDGKITEEEIEQIKKEIDNISDKNDNS